MKPKLFIKQLDCEIQCLSEYQSTRVTETSEVTWKCLNPNFGRIGSIAMSPAAISWWSALPEDVHERHIHDHPDDDPS